MNAHAGSRRDCPICGPLIAAMQEAAEEKTRVTLAARRNSYRYKDAYRQARIASEAVLAAAAEHYAQTKTTKPAEAR